MDHLQIFNEALNAIKTSDVIDAAYIIVIIDYMMVIIFICFITLMGVYYYFFICFLLYVLFIILHHHCQYHRLNFNANCSKILGFNIIDFIPN